MSQPLHTDKFNFVVFFFQLFVSICFLVPGSTETMSDFTLIDHISGWSKGIIQLFKPLFFNLINANDLEDHLMKIKDGYFEIKRFVDIAMHINIDK